MNQIFFFDDHTSIRFKVDAADDELCQLITAHGGIVNDESGEPHFFVGDERRPTDLHPASQVIRPAWIRDSISKKKMIPTHNYLDGADRNLLRDLTQEERDFVELLKAMSWSLGDCIFDIVHRKFPYKTSNEWRGIFQTSQSDIYRVGAQVAADTDNCANAFALGVLALPVPLLPVTPPALGEGDSPNSPSNERDEEQMQPADVWVAGVDSTTSQRTVGRASGDLYPAPTPVNSIYSSGGDGGEDHTEGNGANEYEGSSQPSLKVPSPRQARRPSVAFTPADHDAMVRFVSGLDHKPVKADWENFMTLNMTENSQKRNADAWRRRYNKQKKVIQADIRRLGAQGAPGSGS